MDVLRCKERILSDDYADGVIDFPIERLIREGDDVCYIPLDERFSVAYLNRNMAPDLEESAFQYQYVPKLYGLMQTEGVDGAGQQIFDPSALVSSGIKQLQGPPLNLRGQGVILAFIDTGIEYTNPAFQNEYGESRILAIWDQTDQSGNRALKPIFAVNARACKAVMVVELPARISAVRVKTQGTDLMMRNSAVFFSFTKMLRLSVMTKTLFLWKKYRHHRRQ